MMQSEIEIHTKKKLKYTIYMNILYNNDYFVYILNTCIYDFINLLSFSVTFIHCIFLHFVNIFRHQAIMNCVQCMKINSHLPHL